MSIAPGLTSCQPHLKEEIVEPIQEQVTNIPLRMGARSRHLGHSSESMTRIVEDPVENNQSITRKGKCPRSVDMSLRNPKDFSRELQYNFVHGSRDRTNKCKMVRNTRSAPIYSHPNRTTKQQKYGKF